MKNEKSGAESFVENMREKLGLNNPITTCKGFKFEYKE